MSSKTSVALFTKDQISEWLDYPSLITAMTQGLQNLPHTPQRSHFQLRHRADALDPTMLIMPSWNRAYYGVKLVSVFPENKTLPTIQGVYVLFETKKGRPVAYFDAQRLTTMRTAAVSAAVSKILARNSSRKLLIMGTGKLAPELARAHCAAQSIEQVYIWGRNLNKMQELAQSLQHQLNISVLPVLNLEQTCSEMDIISTATMSTDPIVFGEWIAPGTHLDLVGSYLPTSREADDHLMRMSKVFIDTPTALEESGDLLFPFQKGILDDTIRHHTMDALFSQQIEGRTHEDEITVFKSVGHASEDLITAILIYEKSLA